MINNLSPLRYPGGKAVLAKCLRQIIYDNSLQGCIYVEPFAGGAGAAVDLLSSGHVDRIVVNDADKAIYCLWKSIINHSDELIERILETPITIEEWKKQRETYRSGRRHKQLDFGFSAFYLNRCNRSGIIKNAGPIGGIEQKGKWKLNARFNREDLANRVRELASFEDRIIVTNEDAVSLLYRMEDVAGKGKRFIYADPPYYIKGAELYLSHFQEKDHAELAAALNKSIDSWVLSYDDVPQTRKLYLGQTVLPFSLRYSAHHSSNEGDEILVAPSRVKISALTRKMLLKLRSSSNSTNDVAMAS